MRHVLNLLGAIALLHATAALADKPIEKPVLADTPTQFAEMAQQVRQDMQGQGRYEFIHPDDKGRVEADLQTMQAMLEKSGSVAAMSEQDKIKLFNTQEHVNGILVHNDRERLICEKRAPVGTNIPTTTCRTFGEIERTRRDAQKYMVDHSQDAGVNAAAARSKLNGGGG